MGRSGAHGIGGGGGGGGVSDREAKIEIDDEPIVGFRLEKSQPIFLRMNKVTMCIKCPI